MCDGAINGVMSTRHRPCFGESAISPRGRVGCGNNRQETVSVRFALGLLGGQAERS